MTRPNPTGGLRHVALFVKHFNECQHFYVDLLGMKIQWQPDPDNLYLTTGQDNLALHRAPQDFESTGKQRLDHIGFFLTSKEDVDEWFEFLSKQGVTIKAKPKDHRDGTRSLYCADPDGNVVQLIYYPKSLML